MSIASGYTDEEVRAFVYEHERQSYGTKGAWIKAQPFTIGQFRRWRAAVYDGDLDRGLVPRDGGAMTSPGRRRRIATQAANQGARADADNEQLRARIRELEATNEALGKAIGLLHQLNEQGPDTPETTEPPSS